MPKLPSIIFGLAGWSGSGKTTLAEKLIHNFSRRGYKVGTIKHAHHKFETDIKGKDSWRHREAGAINVIVSSDYRTAHFNHHTPSDAPSLSDLIKLSKGIDILLIEGFKKYDIPKIEIWRQEVKKPFLYTEDKQVHAIAIETRLDDCHIEQLDLNNIEEISDFILTSSKFKNSRLT